MTQHPNNRRHSLDNSEATEVLRQMLLVRRFEERCSILYKAGSIRGFCHLYIGEEAVAVGAIPVLREDDYVITHYRDHGHALARGMDPKVAMAELMGKSTGSSKGKGGSMHLFDVEKGFLGGHAIVGGQMPLAVGLALGVKYQNHDRVVMCFFGDGAVNEGAFHESLNLASLWNLPVLFVLENNLYGMGTHIEETRAGGKDIWNVGEAYNVAAGQVDGMDVLEVRAKTEEAVQRIRSGAGPHLLEAMCYRYAGHSVQDPQFYRQQSEVDQWENKDPIESFRKYVLSEDLISKEQIDDMEEEVNSEISDAVTFAEESSYPEIDELYKDVYAD